MILPQFISGWDSQRHLAEFEKEEVVYLSIISQGELAGFIILAVESEEDSIEFRRIVVSKEKRGIGQAAIEAMEQYCLANLKRTKIWLDVFESNERGKHIYKKLGYRFFKSEPFEGKQLHFYKKQL